MGSMGDAHSGISSCSSCCQAPDTSCLPFDKYEATTKDGWRLVFKHYPPTKQATIKQVQPVLLAHGLAANHTCYDTFGERSLVYVLCSQGFDCWVIDVRGAGLSEKSTWKKRGRGWDLQTYTEDIKLAIDTCLAHFGVSKLHYLGHSLGGMLALGLLGRFPEYADKVASLTTLASGLFLEDSSSRALEWLLKFPDAAEFVGLNWMTRIYSHCVVWPATLFHITNVSRKDVRNVLYNFEPVPVGVLRGMGTAFKKEGMAINYAGEGLELLPPLLKNIKVPVLMMAADFDILVPKKSVAQTFELVGSENKRMVLVGPKPEHKHHYGHVDILVGTNVLTEVFPHVTAFLNQCERDSSSSVVDVTRV